MKAVDILYQVLPTNFHEKYSKIVQKKIKKGFDFTIHSTTGKITINYTLTAIHALKLHKS